MTFENMSNLEPEKTSEDNLTTQEQAQEKGLDQKIKAEQQESKEKFSALIDLVDQRYEAPDSALAGSPEQLKTFKEHNNEVLELCVQRGIEKGLDQKELGTLEVSAILHDLNKADKPAGPKGEIPNYTLAAHGEMASQEVKSILDQNQEILTKFLGENSTPEEKQAIITQVEVAIKTHMGPHPGFMDSILESVNKELEKINEPKIEHPYPPEGDRVAETLLAVDMCSLAGRKGREKVLAIRSNIPFFKQQDEELSKTYQSAGVDLTPGEAALLSGFDSANQARDMLKDQDDIAWIDGIIEDSKKQAYTYEEQEINYQTAISKREKYEEVKKINEVREKIDQSNAG